MMADSRYQFVFFILFVLLIFVLNILVFFPYLSVLFLALVAAIVLDPIYEWLLRKFRGRESLSALAAVFLMFLLIIGPVSFFGALLINETAGLYSSFSAIRSGGGVSTSLATLGEFIQKIFPGTDISGLELDIASYGEKGLSWVLSHMSNLFSGALKVIFGLILFFLALFYFFKDGKKFVHSVVDLSPLNDIYDRKVIERIVSAVNSVVVGRLVVAIAQGILTGIGFALFNVPNPTLWGSVAALASLIPSIGTALIIIPAVLYLFAFGHLGLALGLLVWGVVVVGLVDNFLGPILMKKGTNAHPFLILLSALGGVGFFGPIGFIAGPVLLSVLFALLDIYPDIIRTSRG